MPSTQPTDTPPMGHVVAQTEAQGQDPSGRWVQGVNVTGVIDATGVTFTVFVPQGQYTPDNVARLLAERATQVAIVHDIKFGG